MRRRRSLPLCLAICIIHSVRFISTRRHTGDIEGENPDHAQTQEFLKSEFSDLSMFQCRNTELGTFDYVTLQFVEKERIKNVENKTDAITVKRP